MIAVYTRDELVSLVWDERVPLLRRVLVGAAQGRDAAHRGAHPADNYFGPRNSLHTSAGESPLNVGYLILSMPTSVAPTAVPTRGTFEIVRLELPRVSQRALAAMDGRRLRVGGRAGRCLQDAHYRSRITVWSSYPRS